MCHFAIGLTHCCKTTVSFTFICDISQLKYNSVLNRQPVQFRKKNTGGQCGKVFSPVLASEFCTDCSLWGGALKLQVLENASMENRSTKRQNV